MFKSKHLLCAIKVGSHIFDANNYYSNIDKKLDLLVYPIYVQIKLATLKSSSPSSQTSTYVPLLHTSTRPVMIPYPVEG